MVNTFTCLRSPRILFGEGQLKALPGLLNKTDNHILALTGAKSHLKNPEIARVLSALEHDGFHLHQERIEREPSPAHVDQIVDRYRMIGSVSVIAIGGGSVLDAGKAVSAMLPLQGPTRDYLEGVGNKTHPGVKRPFIAAPTTAGTGSEATSNAVLSETGINGFKRSLRHDNLVPDVAIVDPALTLGCPAPVTAASGMDAFTQLVESYLSVKSTSFTDALALDGIMHVHAGLLPAVAHGDDIEARSDMSYAAMISGITLANAGLGLIHGFASSVGGFFDVPHGIVCGTLMATINRYTIHTLLDQPDAIASRKYALLGKIFSGTEHKDQAWYMHYAADYFDGLTAKLGIRKLGEFGIRTDDLERIASSTDHKASPVKFEKQQLIEMLNERL